MEAKIGIKQNLIEKSAHELCVLLADEFVLYTMTRNAHWNVEGLDFHRNHKFFEEHYVQLEEIIDEVAERIRSLGSYAPGSLAEYLKLTRLTEASREKNNGIGFMKELLMNHESIIIHIREKINLINTDFNDAGTADFITGIMEQHEKMAWMLRSHLS
ncbi:MAG TPA: DNA starvation/stationary phase protection protein [Cyclobacteriaceae bacterium]